MKTIEYASNGIDTSSHNSIEMFDTGFLIRELSEHLYKNHDFLSSPSGIGSYSPQTGIDIHRAGEIVVVLNQESSLYLSEDIARAIKAPTFSAASTRCPSARCA